MRAPEARASSTVVDSAAAYHGAAGRRRGPRRASVRGLRAGCRGSGFALARIRAPPPRAPEPPPRRRRERRAWGRGGGGEQRRQSGVCFRGEESAGVYFGGSIIV